MCFITAVLGGICGALALVALLAYGIHRGLR